MAETDSVPKPEVKGAFVRGKTGWSDSIGEDVPVESGRYTLYVSYACPWAHRTMIVRALKGLEDAISVHVVKPVITSPMHVPTEYKGWEFEDDEPHGFSAIGELYELAAPGFREAALSQGKKPYYSVPVLFDTKTQQIVSNESSEIIVWLNNSWNSIAKNPDLNLLPAELDETMKAIDAEVYPSINNGVCRCGFARSQEAYDLAVGELFESLDRLETVLGRQRYIAGSVLTMSDVRLWVTLARFDAVYHSHFNTCRNYIADMPQLSEYVRDLYQSSDAFSKTLNLDHIRAHYFRSHPMIRPTKLVPILPSRVDFTLPHSRGDEGRWVE